MGSIRKFGKFYLSWALPSTARSRQLILCTSACSSENTFSSSRVGLCNFTNPPWLCILGPPAVIVSITQICYGPICCSFGRRELIRLGYSVNRSCYFEMGYCSMTYFLQWNPDQAKTKYPLLSCIPRKKLNLQTCSSLWTFFSGKGWYEEYDPAYPGHDNLRQSKNIRCDASCTSASSILEISCRLYIALEENLTS